MTPDLLFLRDIAYLLRLQFWDGSLPAPEPPLLTQAERDAAKASKPPGADLLAPDEMLARLGLPTRREEVPDE